MFDAIEAKLYVQRKRLPPKPLEKLEKGVLTRTQEVDSTDSINQNANVVFNLSLNSDSGTIFEYPMHSIFQSSNFHFFFFSRFAYIHDAPFTVMPVCLIVNHSYQ